MSIVSKSWLLTFSSDAGITHERIDDILASIKSINYWCLCDEISSYGVLHTHVFITSASDIDFETLKPFFPFAHFERLIGCCNLGREYVAKEGIFKDFIKGEVHLSDTFEEFGK